MNIEVAKQIIKKGNYDNDLQKIAEKIFNKERITFEDGILLYEKAGLSFLSSIANFVRESKNYDFTYYNRNFHIEPTNICIYKCRFCSYSAKDKASSWELNADDIIAKVNAYKDIPVTEVHMVGGVHPDRDLHYYGEIIKSIKAIRPDIHVKAFTAVELDFMIKKAGYSVEEGLAKLKEYGLDSIPGGGAEIFNENIRTQICHQKSNSNVWLKIHEAAHKLGIPSNATMLYGHIETYSDRVDHLLKLRDLQDKTGMFNAFIPLKFKNKNNEFSEIKETSLIEDLKNYAICRILLDNFAHIKAYWPMIGKETAQLSLSFGVDDLDGTIDDSTKIYSLAGAEDQTPSMNTDDIKKLIIDAKRIPIERDSIYNVVPEN